MKFMNIKNRFPMNLQFFAEGEGSDSEGAGEGDDDPDEGDKDPDKSKKPDKGAKTYTQEEIDDIITKRLERERKKQQKKLEQDKGDKDPDTKAKAADDKVSALEAKLLCFEHDVSKDSVSDVVALAKSYVNEDTDFEEAIEKVIKKYPQFVKGFKPNKNDDENEEDETNNSSWGQRQKGQSKKSDGVEAAFLKKNPGLKID